MAATPSDIELKQRRAVQARILQNCSIASRASWSARAPDAPLDYDWNYDSIVVHYTGHQSYPNMRSIQDLDMEHDRDWHDVAYHYGISRDGKITEGREILFKGSDVYHQNTGKIGIVCLGDFDSSLRNLLMGKGYSGEQVPEAMLRSLERLSLQLRQAFPIRYFGGHIEYGKTAVCPGSKLLPLVQAMRTRLGFGAPTYRDLK